MPRSPLRSPKASLDLSGHLMVYQNAEFDVSSQEGGSSSDFQSPPNVLSSESLFANSRPLEIEVGSGKGLFLTAESARNPDHNFLGIEIIHKYAKRSATRFVKAGRENAKMISGNAQPLLANHVPSESLEAVHVYFPDPWWKKRHRKRRVVNETSIRSFSKNLRVGGRLHFWTDVLDYFESTIELIAEIAPEFGVPIPEEKAPSTHDLDYRTHFERRSRQNQIPVYRVRYQKKAEQLVQRSCPISG